MLHAIAMWQRTFEKGKDARRRLRQLPYELAIWQRHENRVESFGHRSDSVTSGVAGLSCS